MSLSTVPDIPAPDPNAGGGYIKGWAYNAYARRIYKAWSSSVVHGTGWDYTHGASQGGRALYSTFDLAREALLADLRVEFQEWLDEVESLKEPTDRDDVRAYR